MRSSIIKFEYSFDVVSDRITEEGSYLLNALSDFVVTIPELYITGVLFDGIYFSQINPGGFKWCLRFPLYQSNIVDEETLLEYKEFLKGTHEINTKFKPHTVGTMAVLLVLYDMKIIKNLRCEGVEDKWMEARELVRNYFGNDWLKPTN